MKIERRIKAKRGPNVEVRRGRRADEQFVIDSNSPTLTADLTFVFQRNVANARRENERVLRSPDG
jgi:hypothetical protein